MLPVAAWAPVFHPSPTLTNQLPVQRTADKQSLGAVSSSSWRRTWLRPEGEARLQALGTDPPVPLGWGAPSQQKGGKIEGSPFGVLPVYL